MEKRGEAADRETESVSPGLRPYPVPPKRDHPTDALQTTVLGEEIDVSDDGVGCWSPADVVSRVWNGETDHSGCCVRAVLVITTWGLVREGTRSEIRSH